MNGATMTNRYFQPSFQWNRQVSVQTERLTDNVDEDKNTLVATVTAHSLVINDNLTLYSLFEAPISDLSIDTICKIRDEAYEKGIYKFGVHFRPDICQECWIQLDRLWQLMQTYSCSLHHSSFRQVVVMSLYSPFNVIYTILSYFYRIYIYGDSSVSFILDVLLTCRNLISFDVHVPSQPNNQKMSIISSIFRDLLLEKLDIYKPQGFVDGGTIQQNVHDMILSLISRLFSIPSWTEYGIEQNPIHPESFIQSVVQPLIQNNQISTAISTFLCVLSGENEDFSPFVSILTQIFGHLFSKLKYEDRFLVVSNNDEQVISNDDDTFFNDIDKHISIINSLANTLPPHILRLTTQSYLKDMSWYIHLQLYPHLRSSTFNGLIDPVRAQLQDIIIKINGEKNKDSSSSSNVKNYEQLIILCSTSPYLPDDYVNMLNECEGDGGSKIEMGERDIEEWVTAFSRQLYLLTSNELYRLLKDRLCKIVSSLLLNNLSESDRNKKVQNDTTFSFQLCFQSVGLLLGKQFASDSTKLSAAQREIASTRTCRIICNITQVELFASWEDSDRIAYLRLLIDYIVGTFTQKWVDYEDYGSCIDVVTMTLLDVLSRIAREIEGDKMKLTPYRNMINEVADEHQSPPKICSAALSAMSIT